MTRILLVEDDALLARGVVALLKTDGYAVDHVAEGAVAIELVGSEPYGAILLDLGLPDMSGIDVLRALRTAKAGLPVMVLTARDTIGDRVRGARRGRRRLPRKNRSIPSSHRTAVPAVGTAAQ